MSKMQIRQMEEELPTISASMANMRPIERISIRLVYKNAKKALSAIKPRSRLLDVGCGDGLLLNEISNELDWCLGYVGLDMSINKLKCARDRSKQFGTSGKICFVLGDAEHPPFRDLTFDAVVMLEVLEHFSNATACVSELAKIVTPFGKILITTPSACGPKGNKQSIIKLLFRPFKREEPIARKKSIMIYGKQLPHRDYTLAELRDLLHRSFVFENLYSFNFGIQYVAERFLPNGFVILLTNCLENRASVFPKTWGYNWLVLCKKKRLG